MEGLVGEAMQLMVNALGQAEGEGHDHMKGTYKSNPERSELPSDIKEALIVELYSK